MNARFYHCDTFVYRCFAADGTLLYVGMTGDLEVRLKAHSSAVWWTDVAYVRTAAFPGRSMAGVAERCAIRDERPKYNRPGSNGRGARPTRREITVVAS